MPPVACWPGSTMPTRSSTTSTCCAAAGGGRRARRRGQGVPRGADFDPAPAGDGAQRLHGAIREPDLRVGQADLPRTTKGQGRDRSTYGWEYGDPFWEALSEVPRDR